MSGEGEEHFLGKIAQKGIIECNGKVLLTRHSLSETLWELPGGRLNKHELPATGLERELKEELGVNCLVKEIVYAEQFNHTLSGTQTLALIYRVQLQDESMPFAVDPDEVAQMVWVDHITWQQYQLFPVYERALLAYF